MQPSPSQVKTKSRARDHGEVFTREKEVNAMLDLVKPESERIDARFLEPACGNGNFLAQILARKLKSVRRQSRKQQISYERLSLLAVSSIYGIELLQDNIIECHQRLLAILQEDYAQQYLKANADYLKSIDYLLKKNILHGDALSLKQHSGAPILFSQWSFINQVLIQRHDYIYEYLMPTTQPASDLFSPNKQSQYTLDEKGQPQFFPKSIKAYPPTHYLKLWSAFDD